MPNEDFLGESVRKTAKGAGTSFIGAFIGMALGYLSRMIIARWSIGLRLNLSCLCSDDDRSNAFFSGFACGNNLYASTNISFSISGT